MHLFFKIDDKNASKVHIQIKTGAVQGPTTIHWSTVMLKDYKGLLYLTTVLKKYYIDLHIYTQI